MMRKFYSNTLTMLWPFNSTYGCLIWYHPPIAIHLFFFYYSKLYYTTRKHQRRTKPKTSKPKNNKLLYKKGLKTKWKLYVKSWRTKNSFFCKTIHHDINHSCTFYITSSSQWDPSLSLLETLTMTPWIISQAVSFFLIPSH